MKKIIFALTMLLATSAMAQESSDLAAYCSGVEHHSASFDIFTNMQTNTVTIRVTGGDGYPKDYIVDSAVHIASATPVIKAIVDDYLVLGIFAVNKKQDLKTMRLKYTAIAADGSKLSLTVDNGIILNINGYDQDSWCKLPGVN